MTSQRKYIAKHLFLALSPILAYNGINLICILLFASESILEHHYFAFDAIFCILILIIFSPAHILYKYMEVLYCDSVFK